MVFLFDGVFGLGLFLIGGVGGLQVGIELFFQFLGADGRVREEFRMGLEACDDFMEQGYDLGFGLLRPRKVKQNILDNIST